MRRLVSYLVAVVLILMSPHAFSNCSIIYGENWAFAFSTPNRWTSLCQAEQQIGVPVAFWPASSTFADASAVMYINVSTKNEPSLEGFVKYSQGRFRQNAPSVVFVPDQSVEAASKLKVLHFSASGDPGGNVERIAYVEGPTAYFIIVLSSRTPEALERAKPAYQDLIESFIPMSAKVQK